MTQYSKLYEMLRKSYQGQCSVSVNGRNIVLDKGDWQLHIFPDGSSKLLSPNYPHPHHRETKFTDEKLLDALRAFEAGAKVKGV